MNNENTYIYIHVRLELNIKYQHNVECRYFVGLSFSSSIKGLNDFLLNNQFRHGKFNLITEIALNI